MHSRYRRQDLAALPILLEKAFVSSPKAGKPICKAVDSHRSRTLPPSSGRQARSPAFRPARLCQTSAGLPGSFHTSSTLDLLSERALAN